jgi:hypothetical protein
VRETLPTFVRADNRQLTQTGINNAQNPLDE